MKKNIYTSLLIIFGLAILLSGCGGASKETSIDPGPIEDIVDEAQEEKEEENIEEDFEEGFVSEEDDVDLGELI